MICSFLSEAPGVLRSGFQSLLSCPTPQVYLHHKCSELKLNFNPNLKTPQNVQNPSRDLEQLDCISFLTSSFLDERQETLLLVFVSLAMWEGDSDTGQRVPRRYRYTDVTPASALVTHQDVKTWWPLTCAWGSPCSSWGSRSLPKVW